METPFLGGSYVMRSRNLAYDQMINLYLVLSDKPQGKARGMLVGTPGLLLYISLGAGPVRGLWTFENMLYAVSGNNAYRIDPAGTITDLGALNTSTGPVSFCNNPTQLLICDSVNGYVYTFGGGSGTLSVVASFPVGGQFLGYQDGFGITNVAGTQAFYQSDLNDLSTWDPLNFSTADSQPGPVSAIVDLQSQVWLIGPDRIEIWVNVGAAGFVFQRVAGVLPEVGIVAPFSAVKVGESLMFLSQTHEGPCTVTQTQGYNTLNVADEAATTAFQNYAKLTTINDATAFAYQQEGHTFYVLNFPSANATWVYDLKTKHWAQRAYWNNGVFTRHLANCHAYFNNSNIVGDYNSGNLYKLDLNTHSDNGNPKRWVRSWRALPPGQPAFQPITFNSLQIDAQTGIDVPTTLEPVAMLRWSDDGGHKWSNVRYARFGKIGETSARVMYRRLGTTRPQRGLDRIFELSGTDPVPIALLGADMDAEPA